MANNALHKVVEQAKENRRRNRWNKVVTGMAAFVVFCTTYALILPAITEEREPLCGLEEHVHTDKCWELPKVITCPYEVEAENGELPLLVHTHDAFCYDTFGNLICALPEVESHVHDYRCYTEVIPEAPHVHTDECYAEEKVLTCPLEESEGHIHSAQCDGEIRTLICAVPEDENHTHGESCYGTSFGPVCGLEESEGHTHTDECYTIERQCICGKTEATEEELAAYTGEPEKVLTCGKEEVILHQHTAECWDEDGNLICGLNALYAHQHGKECLTTTKDPEAQKVLTCGYKEEHTHDDTCYTDLEADLETPEMWEAGLPQLTDHWADDLLAVAMTQLGYTESTENVTVSPEGVISGYTRYGQWAGTPYGDWSLTFLDFCQHYAGIPADAFPVHEGQLRWCQQLKEENWNIYWTPAQYTPVPGDTVFFDQNVDGTMDAAAIVKELTEATEEAPAKILVIQGDVEGAVAQVEYAPEDPVILGYASLATAKSRWDTLHPAPIPEPTRYCGLEAHTHGEGCYDAEQNLICEIPEHIHNAECEQLPPTYGCGLAEHTHDENCYDNEGNFVCQLEEHTHTQECIVYIICGKEAHIHVPECYDANGEVICGKEEHTHENVCKLAWQTLIGQKDAPGISLMRFAAAASSAPTLSVTGPMPVNGMFHIEDDLVATDCPNEELRSTLLNGFAGVRILDEKGTLWIPDQNVQMTITGLTLDPLMKYTIWWWEPTPVLSALAEPETTEVILNKVEPTLDYENHTLTFNLPPAGLNNTNIALTAAPMDGECNRDCGIDAYLERFRPCSGTNPFGGAQDFNLFLLGNMENWGDVHGNVAVMGDIIGTSNMLSYDAGSNFDYAANKTEAYAIGLLLGGHQNASKKMTVSNGSQVFHVPELPHFDFDPNDTVDHAHMIRPQPGTGVNDIPYASSISEYFMQAKGSATDETSLLWRNKQTYDYAHGLNDEHKGDIYTLGKYHSQFLNDDRDKVSEMPGHDETDYVFVGTNPFYNVINVPYEVYRANGTQPTVIYLDVPYDSYTIINILPPNESVTIHDDEDRPSDTSGHYVKGTPEDPGWKVDSLSMQLRYRDSNKKWVPQPAKHGLENYNQTQQTLINFSPDIDEIEMTIGGDYLYASILGPTVDLDAGSAGVNLQGTIVLESLHCNANNPSSIIASPFMEGAKLNLSKETHCDNVEEGHKHGDGSSCSIDDENTKDGWDNYYCDFTVSTVPMTGGPAVPGTKQRLPLNGDPIVLHGLAPGTYQIINEVVYYQETETSPKVTVDQFGNMMVVYYEHENDVEWKVRYCDNDLNPMDHLYDANGNFIGIMDDCYKFAAKFGKAFAPGGHFWKNAFFKDGSNGKETIFITLAPGQGAGYIISNHYGLVSSKSQAVYKTWGQKRTFTWKEDGVEHSEERIIPVDAPEGAEIQVTLYRRLETADENNPDSWQRVPSTKAHPNPAVLSAKNDWFELWNELEEFAEVEQEDGGTKQVKYIYQAEETVGYPGFELNGGKAQWDPVTSTWRLSNLKQPDEGGKLTVQKYWFKADGGLENSATIEKDPTFQSEVMLLQRRGEIMALDDPEAELRTARFYLGSESYANLLGEKQYFVGSDGEISFDFFVKGDVGGDLSQGNLNELRVTVNGSTPQPTITHGTHIAVVDWYTPITITLNVTDMTSNVTVVLHESDSATRYPIVTQAAIDSNPALKDKVLPPAFSLIESGISTRFIIWEDILTEKQPPIQLRNQPNWKYTWENLPSVLEDQPVLDDNGDPVLDDNGDPLTEDIYYCYYVEETNCKDGYAATYLYSNGHIVEGDLRRPPRFPGVNSGYVDIQNRPPKGGPELPMTGGPGTLLYTLGGLLTVLFAGILIKYNNHKRRKEDFPL